ncbi:MAG: hypothetical protein JWQ76_1273 [Ramlibacter sp.]|nr:hypothetical protein [Ramlibacter sp.]
MTLATLRRTLRTRPWAWLLVLAIWLPAAQWAAATHALVHLTAAKSVDRNDGGLPASCDLCVIAVAVMGSAPAPAPVAALPALPPAAQREPATAEPLFLIALLAYRSRAPPLPYV